MPTIILFNLMTNIQRITGKHLHGKDVCMSCPIEGGVD
nr:MAG TPA: hypothetical protein [Caudoviricetes sp.]